MPPLRPIPARLVARLGAAFALVSSLGCGAAPPSPVASDAQPPEPPPGASARDGAAAADPASWTIVDAMPAWWRAYDESRGASAEAQHASFRKHLVGTYPEVFTESVLGLGAGTPFDLDARVDALMAEAATLEPVMRRLSDQVAKDLPQHRATFERAFPDFQWSGKVYFTVSLAAFDGAVRMVDGEATLMFGLDKVAKIHGDQASLAPLFHHELFHIYHLVTTHPFEGSPENVMYQALWGEGLAVHVAHTLNPDATHSQLVLTDEMVRRADAMMPTLAGEFLANIDSQDEGFYRDWFRGAGQRKDIPIRVGYYLGMRVAERVGRNRTLRELAKLHDPELRVEIQAALEELARR